MTRNKRKASRGRTAFVVGIALSLLMVVENARDADASTPFDAFDRAITDIEKHISNLPNSSFIGNRKPADLKESLVKTLRRIPVDVRKGLYERAATTLDQKIRRKMDGCLTGSARKPDRSDWIQDCGAQSSLDKMFQSLLKIDSLEPIVANCDKEAELRLWLTEITYTKDIEKFHLRRVDGYRLEELVAKGWPIRAPLVDAKGTLRWRKTSGMKDSYRAKGVDRGFLKTDPKSQPAVELLPAEQVFRLGCERRSKYCGIVTRVGEQQPEPQAGSEAFTELEVVAVELPKGSFSFWEPADHLIRLRTGGQVSAIEPGCHILYNADHHSRIPFELDGLETASGNMVAAFRWSRAQAPLDAVEDMVEHTIPILLDADGMLRDLYGLDIWSRQASIVHSVNLIYHLIEPYSSGKFDILFEITGQEAWMPGYGPTTLDGYDLVDEINHPEYYMYNHPLNNEVSYFYVGSDMEGGTAGVAGGICDLDPYDDTFGSDVPHQRNHAWGQQVPDLDGEYEFATLYGRVIVAAHEIGHMLGGEHDLGSREDCATPPPGSWSRLCGSTLMKSGAAGGAAPDYRKPFFSSANDDKIVGCVGPVASP